MLKDRYALKMQIMEANLLFDSIAKVYEHHGDTKILALMLPLAVIQPFYKRLSGAMLMPSGKVKVSLRKAEALAFHNLYMNGIIRSNLITSEINTTIHKTI